MITIHSDNDAVHASPNEIIVNEAQAERHISKHEVEIWGEGAGQNALIAAQCEGYMALVGVRVRPKEEEGDKSRKGMFREPEFSYDANPLQRTRYSAESGKVIVYVNFPSVKLYLGESCEFRETLAAQILVADLVAERCFYEIARRKVESSGVTLRPEAVADRIRRDAFELSREYGAKVHEALVDQDLLSHNRDGQ